MLSKWGIKGRVLFLALVPAVAISTGLTIYDIHTRIRDTERALQDRGLAIVRQLAPACEFGVFSGNYQILTRLARTTLREADVTAVTLISTDGRILAAEGLPRADPPLRATSTLTRPDVTEHATVLVFSAPILQSQTVVEDYLDSVAISEKDRSDLKVLGHVVVELSRTGNFAKKNQIILSSLLITLFGLAVTTLLALRMAHQVTHPIKTLALAVARIGKGDLGTRVHTGSAGEIATLERGVNDMAVALKAVQDAQEERRAVLATVLDSLDAIVYVADMETYELLFLNKYAQRSFGNATGKLCWQALQTGLEQPCEFCTNNKLLRADGEPAEPFVWEFQNRVNRRWYMIQDRAIKWIDGRIVRLEIATDITNNKLADEQIRRLERQLMEISEEERKWIGHELHDGLGQQLTGIAFLSKALSQRLSGRTLPEAQDAKQIVAMINQAISDTRQLARGLQPVEVEEHGLMSALEGLAANISNLFHIDCEFRCEQPVLVHDNAAANHLYRIAQEASHNAVKHGKAKHIAIELSSAQGTIQLDIFDDGTGFDLAQCEKASGMGIQIMRYRAQMIRAKLEIGTSRNGGTHIKVYL